MMPVTLQNLERPSPLPVIPQQELFSPEFLPAILPQDALRARWKKQGLIDNHGLLKVDGRLPSLSSRQREAIAEWVKKKEIPIESTHQTLFWKTKMFLKQVVSLFLGSSPLPLGETAVIGSSVHELIEEYSTETLQERGFLTQEERMGKGDSSFDTDIRFWVKGEAKKGDLRKCLKGLKFDLAKALPQDLCDKKTGALLKQEYPSKYPDIIPDHQIPDAVIGNTAFRKLHVLEDPEQLFMAVTLGDGKAPPLEIIAAHKMQATSLFSMDDLRIDIGSLFGPISSVEGIAIEGGLQAIIDKKTKRARFSNPEKCDARAFFRYFIAQCKGYLPDDPKEIENVLFLKVKTFTSEEVASLLVKCAKNHLPDCDLAILLLMVSSLSSAEKQGAAWNFREIADKIQEMLSKKPLSPKGQAIYDAIYVRKIPFSSIQAALQISAYFHLFAGPTDASLTESWGKPAIQMQFEEGLHFLVPVDPTLELIPHGFNFEAFLPKTDYTNSDEMQIAPYLPSVQLPCPSMCALALAELEPLLAFQFLMVAPSFHLQQALDLFSSLILNEQLISQMEAYLARHKIYPRWNLKNVKSKEEWIQALGSSGVLELCRAAKARWKKGVASGIQLFTEFLKVDFSLALSMRKSLLSQKGFTKEMAESTMIDACNVAKKMDPNGLCQGELLTQAISVVNASAKREIDEAILRLPLEHNIDLCLAVLSRGKSKQKLPDPIWKLLQENHPRRRELLSASLHSPYALGNVKEILHEVSASLLLDDKREEAIRLWQAAKTRHIGVFDHFQALPCPKRAFLTELLCEKLLTAEEALQCALSLKEEECGEIVTKIVEESKIKCVPEELVSLILQPSSYQERLAKALLLLPCPLPKSLEEAVQSLLDAALKKGEHRLAFEWYDLAEKKGLKLTCPEAVRFKAEALLKAQKVDLALPYILELKDWNLLEKVNGVDQNRIVSILKVTLSEKAWLSLSYLKKLKKENVGTLKGEIQTFCQSEFPNFSVEQQRDLLLCLNGLGISLQMKGWNLVPLAKKFPEVRPLITPFLSPHEAFPYLPLLNKMQQLLKEESLAPFAEGTVRELCENKQWKMALHVILKHKVQDPKVLKEVLSKQCGQDPVACWKAMPGQLDEKLTLQILQALAKSKDPFLIDLLSEKRELQEKVPEKVLIQVIAPLFLGCFDQEINPSQKEALFTARREWQYLITQLERQKIVKIDFKFHHLLTTSSDDSPEKELQRLTHFYSHKEYIAPLEEEFKQATNALLEKCKKATLSADVKESLTKLLLLSDSIKADLLPVISFLAKSQERKVLKRAFYLLQESLDSLPATLPLTSKIECELIVRRLLAFQEEHTLFEIFCLLDQEKAHALFTSRDTLIRLHLEAICQGFKNMNLSGIYCLPIILNLRVRMKDRLEQFVKHEEILTETLNQMYDVIFILITDPMESKNASAYVGSSFLQSLVDIYKKQKLPPAFVQMKASELMIQLISARIKSAVLFKTRSLKVQRLKDIVDDSFVMSVETLYPSLPTAMEDVVYRFCMECIKTEDRELIKVVLTLNKYIVKLDYRKAFTDALKMFNYW